MIRVKCSVLVRGKVSVMIRQIDSVKIREKYALMKRTFGTFYIFDLQYCTIPQWDLPPLRYPLREAHFVTIRQKYSVMFRVTYFVMNGVKYSVMMM